MNPRTVFPGGSLMRALFHRPLMTLADRGGASGTVGESWGGHCVRFLALQSGRHLTLPGGATGMVTRVIRLDTLPAINRFASRHGLSNPDFLIEVATADGTVLVAVDAKFSIETARAKQVSAEVVTALIETEGSPIAPIVDLTTPRADGLFLSPDFPLTHEVLNGRFGIGRLTVRRDQVVLIPATSDELFAIDPTQRIIDAFAEIDGYASAWRGDLMLGLYGLRCAAAAVGCWRDEVRPLLGEQGYQRVDDDKVLREIAVRASAAGGGWDLLRRWDADAEVIRAQRVAVGRASQLPMPARDLRGIVEEEARRVGVAPPSLNSVRRQLAARTRDRLSASFGVLLPPLDDGGATLVAISTAVAAMADSIRADLREIVAASDSERSQ